MWDGEIDDKEYPRAILIGWALAPIAGMHIQTVAGRETPEAPAPAYVPE